MSLGTLGDKATERTGSLNEETVPPYQKWDIPNFSERPSSFGSLQLLTPLVLNGCLVSDPILLHKRRIICRPIFEQINTYTAKYISECILNKTQKENKINILNIKQIQLKNTVDTINKVLAPVMRIIYMKTNVSYSKPF